MAGKAPNIVAYLAQTPNGNKISMLLEELGLPYKVHNIEMSKMEQKEPWFLEINPNGRIPALTDTFDDGQQIRLFESGSIMQYLVATYDKDFKLSYPPGSREYYETNNWLFFLNSGLGPMQGQANHFFRYAPEKIAYGIERYQNETRRLYGVLEKHLKDAGTDYIVGNKLTIADLAHWGWIHAAGWAGVEIDDYPLIKAWEERIMARPACAKGKDVPVPNMIKERLKDPKKAEEIAAQGRAWIVPDKKDAGSEK